MIFLFSGIRSDEHHESASAESGMETSPLEYEIPQQAASAAPEVKKDSKETLQPFYLTPEMKQPSATSDVVKDSEAVPAQAPARDSDAPQVSYLFAILPRLN